MGLMKDSQFAQLCGIGPKQLVDGWDKDPKLKELGLPDRLLINKRGYRDSEQGAIFIANLIAAARTEQKKAAKRRQERPAKTRSQRRDLTQSTP
jgi:hypothetical protein